MGYTPDMHRRDMAVSGLTRSMRRVLIACFALAVLPTSSVADESGAKGRTDQNPSDVPASPVHVSLPEGFDDEASFARSVQDDVKRLIQRAEQAQSRALQAELFLAAANRLLASGMELACTSRLMRLKIADEAPTDSSLGALLDRVDVLLGNCETASGDLERGTTDAPDGAEATESGDRSRRETITHRLAALRAFAQAVRAYALPGGGSRSARSAASGLSFLREDHDPQTAAAASLWQAALRSEEAEGSRALSILDEATADLPAGSLPYSFFARLLRCRLLAERGSWAASLAMVMQVEERCNDWFTDDDRRELALHSCAALQIDILRQWHDGIATPAGDEQRAWCVQRISQIASERLADGKNGVMRLSPAIPVIAPPPRDAALRSQSGGDSGANDQP